ncbi:sensor histidine kinase [Clostridium beijerinckii]|uniref:sensor histidine kinase n=1 Tax=Clostridium beijerinckii TaxID=1520 RepID=UPI0015705747|nr:HAMP domain-containing sensor histidine kinase [Clostridium beijerinckii]NRT74329.1 signal transduction histidine kinase [Clostridium beijerinckii]
MDTNLKNKKKTINKKFILLSLCIALLPILLALSKGLINTDGASREKTKLYNNYVTNLMFSLPYIDENGKIREDAIDNEINSIKYNNKINLKNAQHAFETCAKELGIDPTQELKASDMKNIPSDSYEEYTNLKNDYDEAKNNLNESESEYRTEAIKNINDILTENSIENTPINLEYYIEFQSGHVNSNINSKSKNQIIDETKNQSKDYIMFLDIAKNSPKETHITTNMPWELSALIHQSHLDTDIADLKNVIIRVPASLKEGDQIYITSEKIIMANYIGYVALSLLVIDICLIGILNLRLVKSKVIELKQTSILSIYNKLFIEIKLLAVLSMITLLFRLHSIADTWGTTLIEDYIEHIVDSASLPIVYAGTFYIQLLSLFIGASIVIYLVICDLYKLYLSKNVPESNQYIISKSFFCILYSKFTSTKCNISMTKRTTILSIIVALYLALIIWGTVYTSQHVFFFTHLSGNIITFLAINLLGMIFLIINTALLIINVQKIKAATDNILNGNYKNEIKIRGSFLLKELANNITNIEAGLDKAIDKAVKSERMKGELITNVSHDLKTPLTSIINYVDLLDKGNVSEEKKKEYLSILKERSSRLKILIEDLFEASKAASGTLELNMEELDPIALIRQTLGEFEDTIIISNLKFIKRIPDAKLYIYADGKKTFRVFQNLVSNIIKYSLRGTRVYIDVEDVGKYVSITFKNISQYPLKFTETEILERFKRGDASRTTEGSGLGLAIAKNLVELQNGIFELKFDGDLFKAKVLLKKEKF